MTPEKTRANNCVNTERGKESIGLTRGPTATTTTSQFENEEDVLSSKTVCIYGKHKYTTAGLHTLP